MRCSGNWLSPTYQASVPQHRNEIGEHGRVLSSNCAWGQKEETKPDNEVLECETNLFFPPISSWFRERTVVETPKPISIQIEDETRETDTTLGMKKGKLSLIVKQIKQVENADSDGSEVWSKQQVCYRLRTSPWNLKIGTAPPQSSCHWPLQASSYRIIIRTRLLFREQWMGNICPDIELELTRQEKKVWFFEAVGPLSIYQYLFCNLKIAKLERRNPLWEAVKSIIGSMYEWLPNWLMTHLQMILITRWK